MGEGGGHRAAGETRECRTDDPRRVLPVRQRASYDGNAMAPSSVRQNSSIIALQCVPFGTDSRTKAAFRGSDVSSVRNGTAPRRVLKSSAPNRTAGTDPGAVAVSGPAGYVGRCASREKTEFSCFQRIQTHQMTAHEHDNLSLVPRTIRHLSLSPSTCQDLTPDPNGAQLRSETLVDFWGLPLSFLEAETRIWRRGRVRYW